MNIKPGRLAAAALLLGLAAPGFGQVRINNIEVADGNGDPTGNTVLSQPGASITVRNDFNVDIVIRLKDENGNLVAEASFDAMSTETVNHGQGEGKYAICGGPAGGSFKEYGTLCVEEPDRGGTPLSIWRPEEVLPRRRAERSWRNPFPPQAWNREGSQLAQARAA